MQCAQLFLQMPSSPDPSHIMMPILTWWFVHTFCSNSQSTITFPHCNPIILLRSCSQITIPCPRSNPIIQLWSYFQSLILYLNYETIPKLQSHSHNTIPFWYYNPISTQRSNLLPPKIDYLYIVCTSLPILKILYPIKFRKYCLL